jgi:hypothetical protein
LKVGRESTCHFLGDLPGSQQPGTQRFLSFLHRLGILKFVSFPAAQVGIIAGGSFLEYDSIDHYKAL